MFLNDNRTLLFTTQTANTHRPDKVWRFDIVDFAAAASGASDRQARATLMYHEADERFHLALWRSRSGGAGMPLARRPACPPARLLPACPTHRRTPTWPTFTLALTCHLHRPCTSLGSHASPTLRDVAQLSPHIMPCHATLDRADSIIFLRGGSETTQYLMYMPASTTDAAANFTMLAPPVSTSISRCLHLRMHAFGSAVCVVAMGTRAFEGECTERSCRPPALLYFLAVVLDTICTALLCRASAASASTPGTSIRCPDLPCSALHPCAAGARPAVHCA